VLSNQSTWHGLSPCECLNRPSPVTTRTSLAITSKPPNITGTTIINPPVSPRPYPQVLLFHATDAEMFDGSREPAVWQISLTARACRRVRG
jgi:hypothetical protein